MSSKSFTSGSMRSCAGSMRLGTTSGHELVFDSLYERKRDKKSVRVLTVIIYVFCVSLAAIMLSLYYVFFWEPKDAQYAQRKVLLNVEKQTSTTPLPTCLMPYTGGGDTPVNEHTPLTSNSFTIPANESVSTTPANQTNQTMNDIEDLTESVYPINGTTNDTGSFNYTESIT
ncbi:uncharacterized protein LOC114245794 isoform X1 [Bombyx mandarina]|uniref:Uncharacterized protein LOC114245794 isoform X1 n=1 Tax=Bombyx mandarina TaxID=7092 RepID=A0A6J2JWE7_BOMMA|nr:uncharacterized protein LOC114245794 isoform X1 [Bombyx mandarina]